LYWGRLAALLLRILYALFPEVDWGFVFVDDFCWILRSTNASWLTPALLGVLLALGTPLSWKKTVLSEINTWLGFVINPSGSFVQMAKDKRVAVLALLRDLQLDQLRKVWEESNGPLRRASKPFLQPFVAVEDCLQICSSHFGASFSRRCGGEKRACWQPQNDSKVIPKASCGQCVYQSPNLHDS